VPEEPRLEDLYVFSERLRTGHPNLFFNMSERAFHAAVGELWQRAPSLSDGEFELELRKILARIGDPHTDMPLGSRPRIPVTFYPFEEGVAAVATANRYVSALSMRLVSVDEVPIDRVIERLATVIPHRNRAQLLARYPDYLVAPGILYHLGIAQSPERIHYRFREEQGGLFTVPMEPVAPAVMPEMIQLNSRLGIHGENAPLGLRESSRLYWHEYDSSQQLLYIRFDACRPDPEYAFGAFRSKIGRALGDRQVRNVVIDFRRNDGGDPSFLAPFIDQLSAARDRGHRFALYLLIGRHTSPAAVRNAVALEQQLGAQHVGEPSGGTPNYFGNVQSFRLPNLGQPVAYGTRFFGGISAEALTADAAPNRGSLMPDIEAPPSLSARFMREDPAMAKIRFERN
jgi:hypothetical protein